ncbi:unnamed protein product [Lota lota]
MKPDRLEVGPDHRGLRLEQEEEEEQEEDMAGRGLSTRPLEAAKLAGAPGRETCEVFSFCLVERVDGGDREESFACYVTSEQVLQPGQTGTRSGLVRHRSSVRVTRG